MGYEAETETEQTVFAAKKGGLTMKKKIFATLAAAAMLCGCLAAPASAAEAKDYKMGDVNMDGVVNITDAQLALLDYTAHISGVETLYLKPEQEILANVNGETRIFQEPANGKEYLIIVDLTDAQLILYYYAASLVSENITLADVTGRTDTYLNIMDAVMKEAQNQIQLANYDDIMKLGGVL